MRPPYNQQPFGSQTEDEKINYFRLESVTIFVVELTHKLCTMSGKIVIQIDREQIEIMHKF